MKSAKSVGYTLQNKIYGFARGHAIVLELQRYKWFLNHMLYMLKFRNETDPSE